VFIKIQGSISCPIKTDKKNLFHKNKSDRLKGQYSKKVGGEGVKKVVVKKNAPKKVAKKVTDLQLTKQDVTMK